MATIDSQFSWTKHVEIGPADVVLECQEFGVAYEDVVELYLREDPFGRFDAPAPVGGK